MGGVELLAAFDYGTKVDDNIYGVTISLGILVSYSINDNRLSIIGSDEQICGTWAYSLHGCSSKESVFFSANRGDELLEYSLTKNTFEHHVINGLNTGKGYMCFVGLAKHNNSIYLFPRYEETIIRFDLDRREFIYEKNKINNTADRRCGFQIEGCFYILYENGDIYSYNMDNNEVKHLGLFKECKEAIRLNVLDNKLYVLMKHGDIWVLDDTQLHFNQLTPAYSDSYSASNFIKVEKEFIVLPSLSDEIIRAKDGIVESIMVIPKEIDRLEDPGRGYFENCIDMADGYLFLTKRLDRFLLVDKHNGSLKWIKPDFPSREEFVKIYMNCNRILKEGMFKLADYVKNIICV